MSETDTTQPEVLTEALEEHPEEVAEFVEHLDLVNELLTGAELGMTAVEDDMVVSLAHAGNSLGEIADAASEDETAEGLLTVLRAVGEVQADDSVPEQVGPVGLLGALQDPDVQMGIGYLVAVAQALGRNVREE